MSNSPETNGAAGKGDTSTGRPEGSVLGYGLSGGRGAIWVCVPYLNGQGDRVATTWWGDKGSYDPEPTLKYLRDTVRSVCCDFGGDETRVVLSGFSRGAIACNYLGLHDDETAELWCGFFLYSHYDGFRSWPFPASDPASALSRLKRLGSRPQFICGEGANVDHTQAYLRPLLPEADLTFVGTGFRNHNDAWILCSSSAREQARAWFEKTVRPS